MNEVNAARARHERLRAIFHHASDLTGPERDAYLQQQRTEHPELADEIDAYFADATQLTDPLRPAVLAEIVRAVPSSDSKQTSAAAVPERLGRYRILRQLGAGGAGVVYEAEQDYPQRRVALKLMRFGEQAELLRRFEHEARLLAQLRHPGIAQIYDAGRDELAYASGMKIPQQYIAMELIAGLPLYAYAEQAALANRDRLELVARVADAVDHAHKAGVVHRDLKPANILVDEHQQPKVLDFGVARVTNADANITTMQTATGMIVGTLSYMSPEQVAGDSRQIDHRADVYALGVILYELLARQLPHRVAGMTIPEAARHIQEDEPSRLGVLRTECRGDIETIVAKALEKDIARRYDSASALAADIRRYLQDQPIVARPASTFYQLQKFARRHKAIAGGVAIAFVALLAGTTAATYGLFSAREQRNAAIAAQAEEKEHRLEAERQTAIAEAVNDFLNDGLLAAVDPGRTADREITMREVLDIAATEIENRFPDQPLVEAEIRTTLANTYSRLGAMDASEKHRRRAIELLATHRGPDHDDTMAARNSLATTMLVQGRFAEAARALEEDLAQLRQTRAADDGNVLRATSNLAVAFLELGQFEQAAPLLEETLAGKRRTLGDRDPSTLTSINNLAGLLQTIGQHERARKLYEETYSSRREVLGETDPKTMATASAYAWCLTALDRTDEARKLLDATIPTARERLGEAHPITLRLMNSLGRALAQQEDYDAAETVLRELVKLRSETLGADHRKTLESIANLALVIQSQGLHKEAIDLFTAVLAADERAIPASHWQRSDALTAQATSYVALGAFSAAEEALLKAHAIIEARAGADHETTEEVVAQLIECYDAWNAAEPDRGIAARAAKWHTASIGEAE